MPLPTLPERFKPTLKSSPRTLLIDFDGVLHSYASGWLGVASIPDKPIPGAFKWLCSLCAAGYDVCIYSARSRSFWGRMAMRRWIAYYLFEELRCARTPLEDPTGEDRWKWALVSLEDTIDSWEALVDASAKRFVGRLRFPIKKPAAWLTIDDRAMCFTGEYPSLDAIDDFKPWNKVRV